MSGGAIVTEEELAEQLAEMARLSADAEAFLGELAAAVLPAHQRDRDHLTWRDPDRPGERGAGGHRFDGERSTDDRLREAEQRFRTLVEQIPAVTFMAVLGEGKNEVYVSPHIEQMLGYSQEEWLENPFLWYWRLHPDDRQMWNEEFARGCRAGGPFRAECRFLARDGRYVWVHGEARVVRDERGRPQFLQGVAFDITESKRAQEILLADAVRTAKHQEEMAIAQRVQTSMLPRDPAVEGLEIAAAMQPADEVGGDYYDVLPFPGGAWLAVGDVSGHGLDAGLVMLMLRSTTASVVAVRGDGSPAELLQHINGVMVDNIRQRLRTNDHVTFSLLRYTTDGRVQFAGAHEEMIVVREAGRRIEVVPTPGVWIGVKTDVGVATRDSELRLEPGDLLVLYTDGVTEAMNGEGAQFGLERLCAAVEEARDRSAAELRDHVLAAVRGWMRNQADDVSLLVLRYLGTP